MIILMICPLWAYWLYLCFIFWCWFWGLQCYISNLLHCASSKAHLFTCVFKNLTLGASVPHPSAVHAHSLLIHVINPGLRCYYVLKNNQLSFNEIGKWRASFIFTCFRSPAFIALCSSEFESAIIFPLSQERALAVHFFSFYFVELSLFHHDFWRMFSLDVEFWVDVSSSALWRCSVVVRPALFLMRSVL